MTEQTKNAMIHILHTMWDISQRTTVPELKDWQEGRLSGLNHALFCCLVTKE